MGLLETEFDGRVRVGTPTPEHFARLDDESELLLPDDLPTE